MMQGELSLPVPGVWVRRLATIAGALAIASVPIFSSNKTLSFVPQVLAVLALLGAFCSLFYRIPRIHLAIAAYLGLVAFWGITLLWEPDLWQNYQTSLKIAALTLTVHIVFRTKGQLLLLFAVYCSTSLITLSLNWNELHSVSALADSEVLSDEDRFAGTFANANTAGMYGVLVLLFALITFFNTRSRWRWAVLLTGVAGLIVCYFSGSRKGMLGLGVVALAAPWMAAVHSQTGRLNWLKGAAIAATALILAAVAFSNLPFADRLLITLKQGIGAESSGQARVDMLGRAFALWTEHPFFGCGFDGFARESGFGVYSHTTFGEVLCNGGLVGITLLGIYYLLPSIHMVGLLLRTMGTPGSRLFMGLLVFWGVFVLFSTFAVLLDSREYLAIYAAICGYVQENRLAGIDEPEGVASLASGELEQDLEMELRDARKC